MDMVNFRNTELILPKLRCVKCGSSDLKLDKDRSVIVCKNCGAEYRVIEDIPIMLPSEEFENDYNVRVFDENSERYDSWFEKRKGKLLYKMELDALKAILYGYTFHEGVEIGVGSGRFASKIGVRYGLDPSLSLLKIAIKRGITGVLGIGEITPFKSSAFDFVLIMFSICFLKDGIEAVKEASRILKENGLFAIGFIPKGSKWGDFYIEKGRKGGVFYKNIRLYSEEEIKDIALRNNLAFVKRVGTLTQRPSEKVYYEEPKEGKDDFSFVVHLYKKNP